MKTKHRTSVWILLGVFIFLTRSVLSQPIDSVKHEQYLETAKHFVSAALQDQKGYELLEELCQFGPRLSGSENSLQAIHWVKQKMEDLDFDRVRLQPVMVPHWVRGDVEQAEIVETGEKLTIAALGGSIGTANDGVTARVLEVSSFEELKARASEAEGKIIFFNRPMDATQMNTFAAYGGAVNQRARGAIHAARYGGVAALVRSMTVKYDDVPHVGSMSYVDTVKQIPAAAISLVGADMLSAALEKKPNLRVRLQLTCQTLPDAQSYNVIGEITGTEKPDEIILVGGHFDSWDKGHGAHDDGAGCIQALEVPALFKRLNLKPKRTIRCVLFINEENGVRGGIEYGKVADSDQTEKHIAAIESDRGAFTPRGFTVDGDSAVISHLNQWLPYLRQASIEWVKRGYSGVDIAQIKSCPLKIGYAPDSHRYFDYHHSDNDVFSEVHPREMELGSAAMAILVYLLSEEEGWLNQQTSPGQFLTH